MADSEKGAVLQPQVPLPSTLQIQSAIDQLTYLSRILHGDDNMSLTELLASTSASGPSSSLPSGGLTKALPSLLGLLLPGKGESGNFDFGNGNMSQSQKIHLAKTAAFQPRRYLAMTAELTSRTSDIKGEMYRAIELAQALLNQSDPISVKDRRKQKMLQDRKRRKLEADNSAIARRQTQSLDKGEILAHDRHVRVAAFTSSTSYTFPSKLHGQAKEILPTLENDVDEEKIESFLKAWRMELTSVDVEASSRIKIRVQQWFHDEKGKRCLLRMKIANVGFAWIWVQFNPIDSDHHYLAQIQRVNVLAESEVEAQARLMSSTLQPSIFPLYRRITFLLQTKFIEIELQQRNAWGHLVAALFALSSLCRLHEIHPPDFNLMTGTILRGQENVLTGLIRFSTDNDVDDEPQLPSSSSADQIDQAGTKTDHSNVAGQEDVDIHSPHSALFSDQME